MVIARERKRRPVACQTALAKLRDRLRLRGKDRRPTTIDESEPRSEHTGAAFGSRANGSRRSCQSGTEFRCRPAQSV